MAKIKKEKKPIENGNKQNKKHAEKPQKPGLEKENGVVKTKNKVKNGPHGNGKNTPIVSVPLVKIAKSLKKLKNKNAPESNGKTADGEKLQQNDKKLKKQLKKFVIAASEAADEEHNTLPQSESPVAKKNKAPKFMESPAAVKPNKTPERKRPEEVKTPQDHAKAKRAATRPFNETFFKKIGSAVKTLNDEESEETKKPYYKFMLGAMLIEFPNYNNQFVEFHLKHSLISEDDNVCLFVRDSERGGDFEVSKQKWEDHLKVKGVTGVKTVIPFSQIEKDYTNYDLHSKLLHSYDVFLCDETIFRKTTEILGKYFRKNSCVPIPIRMDEEDLSHEFLRAGKQMSFRILNRTLIPIPIGTNKMTTDHLLDNLQTVIEQFKVNDLGGYENIRSVRLSTFRKEAKSLPIYVNLVQPPAKAPKEEKEVILKFHMTNDGVLVKYDDKLDAGKKRAVAAVENAAEVQSNKKAKMEEKQNLIKFETEKKGKKNSVKVEPVAEKKKGKAEIVKSESDESEEDDSENEGGVTNLKEIMKRVSKKNNLI